jgi:hypothetical protein
VNLFLAGWRPAGGIDRSAPAAALRRLLESLPFFPGRPVEEWAAATGRFAAAWVRHDADLPYACERDGALALFAGRPFRWTGDAAADGRGPADARFFLEPAEVWSAAIDGRFASASYRPGDDETLELATDPVGAYPLYEAQAAGARWFSNSAAALRELTGEAGLRLETVAGLVGGGWPLAGDPVWSAVTRVEPGAVVRLRRGGEQRTQQLPAEDLARMPGAGLDPEAAAHRLTAATAALSDWPRRPAVVPVTGGRDSRVILAAALSAGIPFEGVTGGAPGDPDVTVARRLCLEAGVRHSLLPRDPHGDLWSDHRRAARIVRLTAGGTASLADAAGFPLGPGEGPLPLWQSGQGGEVGRAYYGPGDGLDAAGLTQRLYDAFTARRPHRREPLSAAGRDLVEREIRAWVDSRLGSGARPADVPDLFYLERRMATWAAPTHGCVEYVRDTTSPLWSRRVLPDLLAAPAQERAGAPYHRAVLGLLAPRLAEIELAGGTRWDAAPSRLAHARALARKAVAETARRVRARRAGAGGAADPLDPILADVREQVLDAREHPAWAVLDRDRCEALLSRPAAALDEMSRYHVWRLATLFVE